LRAHDDLNGIPEAVSLAFSAADALHFVHGVETVGAQFDAFHRAEFGAPAAAGATNLGNGGEL
jgi:hypothetical protein